jgi:hypothetical protein
VHYSFVVRSEFEVDLPEYLLTIGEGVDTFHVVLLNESLEAFKAKLAGYGVQVLQAHQLDGLAPVPSVEVFEAQLAGSVTPLLGARDPGDAK